MGGSVFAESMRCMAFQGRLGFVGYVDNTLNATIDLEALHAKRLCLFGVSNKNRTPAQRADGIARIMTMEQGKPLAESTAEIAYTAAFLRYLASLNLESRLIEDNDNRRVEMRRKPLGVVGCIIPWNFPVLIVAFKAPVALLCNRST